MEMSVGIIIVIVSEVLQVVLVHLLHITQPHLLPLIDHLLLHNRDRVNEECLELRALINNCLRKCA